MKKTIILLAQAMMVLLVGCVSPKEFSSYKSSQTQKVRTIENSIDNLNSKILRLSTEINSLNQTLLRFEKKNTNDIKLLDKEITELKNRIKGANDVIASLRIEVALLRKKQKKYFNEN
jgi:peptidoglycan hydrolase CwlO-like protein